MTSSGTFGLTDDLARRIEDLRPSIPGWCSPEKAAALAGAVLVLQARTVVEIGVFGGSSLIPIAMALQHQGSGCVFGIDPWDTSSALEEMVDPANLEWWRGVDLESIRKGCELLLERHALNFFARLVQGRSEDVVGRFVGASVDLLHIDGNHSEAKSVRDVELYLPKVRAGGLVFFDDVQWVEGGRHTTARAVELLKEACEPMFFVGDCVVMRKLARPAEEAP